MGRLSRDAMSEKRCEVADSGILAVVRALMGADTEGREHGNSIKLSLQDRAIS